MIRQLILRPFATRRSAVLAAGLLLLPLPAILPASPAAAQYPGRNYDNGNGNDAAVAAARAQVRAARDQLQDVIRQKRAEFEAKPETIQAKQEAEQADAAWEVERSRVVAALKQANPDYARLAERAAEMQAEVDAESPGEEMSAGGGTATPSGAAGVSTGGDGSGRAADLEEGKTPDPEYRTPATNPAVVAEEEEEADQPRGTGGPATEPATQPAASPEQVARAAEVLEVKQTMDAMEDAAILKDEKAVAAKNAYEAAAAKTKVLDTKLRADLLGSSEYEQAKRQLEQAQTRLAAVSTYNN